MSVQDARKELLAELRAAVHQAIEDNQSELALGRRVEVSVGSIFNKTSPDSLELDRLIRELSECRTSNQVRVTSGWEGDKDSGQLCIVISPSAI